MLWICSLGTAECFYGLCTVTTFAFFLGGRLFWNIYKQSRRGKVYFNCMQLARESCILILDYCYAKYLEINPFRSFMQCLVCPTSSTQFEDARCLNKKQIGIVLTSSSSLPFLYFFDLNPSNSRYLYMKPIYAKLI